MKKLTYTLTAATLALMTAALLRAQDPVKVDSKHYKVVFENDQVRVLRIQYPPGDKSPMHQHPDSVAVFLTDQRAKFTYPDGKSEEISARAGEAKWTPAGTHEPENVGDKPIDVVLVELKGKAEKK
jgi:quercetin dioxygenase-like cupin family protein